jgi:hypothetical protein
MPLSTSYQFMIAVIPDKDYTVHPANLGKMPDVSDKLSARIKSISLTGEVIIEFNENI